MEHISTMPMKTTIDETLPELAEAEPLRLHSLSFVVTVWTAAAIALAMAGYAVFQFLLMPDLTVRELALRHLWHVIALGGVTYLACWLVFHRVLWKPLNGIYLHLYALGKGELEPLQVHTHIEELHTIADGINLLIWRISQERDANKLAEARSLVSETRALATQLNTGPGDSAERVLRNLDTLDDRLQTLASARTPTLHHV